MNQNTIKHYAYLLGKLLGIAGVIFVFYQLFKEYTLTDLINKFSEFKTILIPLIMLNLLSTLTGIYAWHMMLMNYAKTTFPYKIAYYYFSKTEVAKYLPGNVFHFIGRQAIASKLGISQTEMGRVSLLLMSLLLLATILSALIFALMSSTIPMKIQIAFLSIAIVALLSLRFLYPTFTFSKKLLLAAILTFSISMQGLMLSWIITYQMEISSWILFNELAGVYIVSWLIGFVTPGASGGLGVREGAFVAIVTFLHIDIQTDIVVFSVFLTRLINILIDALLYLSTYSMTIENKWRQ